MASVDQVGFIKVIMETSVASGVRRIEAVAGDALTTYVLGELDKQDVRWNALNKKRSGQEPLDAFVLSPVPRQNWHQLLHRQEQLIIAEAKARSTEKEEAKRREAEMEVRALEEVDEAIDRASIHGDIPYLTKFCGEACAEYLVFLSVAINKKWKGVSVLGAIDGDRAVALVSVHESLAKKVHAGRIISGLAPIIGGRGGGKATLAQARGDKPASVTEMLNQVTDHIFD